MPAHRAPLMSRSWAGGSTRSHRRARAIVLTRDAGTCQLAIPGICLGTADVAHHTLGKTVTGDDPAHMVAACAPCNGHVGDPRAADPAPIRPTEW